MRIVAWGDYYGAVAEQPPELKTLVKEATGQSVRRIDRFIQLALIGAGRCIGGRAIDADTAVYLASGRGDMEITVEVMEQLFRAGQPPKPLSFINTVSNAACFYIAQNFALNGRSSFICSRYFAFENALQLALLDLATGVVGSALIGAVDATVPPLHDHRRRLDLAEDTPVGEGSHWLWLSADARADAAAIVAVRSCVDRAALLAWIAQLPAAARAGYISGGQFLAAAELQSLQRETGLQSFDYRAERTYYDSQSGAAVGAFLTRPGGGSAEHLLHINADPDGRYTALLLRAGSTR